MVGIEGDKIDGSQPEHDRPVITQYTALALVFRLSVSVRHKNKYFAPVIFITKLWILHLQSNNSTQFIYIAPIDNKRGLRVLYMKN